MDLFISEVEPQHLTKKWTRLIVETNIKCQIINYEFRKKEKGCVRTLTGTVEGIFRVMNTTDYSTGEL
jgi:hypothetical protein